ncbi:hypothetical protein KFK09_011775 [Dendrobium nobile]|uniref:Uncharacterized protein n=1 Tax=Dendrobium nobile TaxID=94219 RepID=A0A8T3BGT8_DENNO|nr:hypothetical protein KFK09_026724 [Dendrobium nobile]KAI0511151.1 hypothetical protein KFK09_011775 [Dendrobium nobile]
MSGDHFPSRDSAVRENPVVPPVGRRRPDKGARADDLASTVTSDSLIIFRKKFHFPNDVVAVAPKRSDRAGVPPPGYLTICETHLRSGLRFPLPAELIEILMHCGVSISQFTYRGMSVMIGLIALFRDRGAILTPERLSRMGRFTSDAQGRITFRSKWLDMRTRDPAKSWANAFFFVKNEWGLAEKQGKLRDLPVPLHVGEEDIKRFLKVPDVEHLLYDVRYMNKYTEEEFLFKVGMSVQAGRSDARMLKLTSKIPERPAGVPKAATKRQTRGEDLQASKKKKLEGVATSKAAPVSSPSIIHIPENVLSHQCIGRRKAGDLLSRRTELEVELTEALNHWNDEFVRVKYLHGEFKRKYDLKAKEVKILEEELCGCRTELANMVHSASLQNHQTDQLQIDLVEAQSMIAQLSKDQKSSAEKIAVLEAENKRSQTLIAEKEAVLTSLESSGVIEDFKKSIAFKIIIQDHVQEARDHIYEVEVKALEKQCVEEGFIRGFLKGIRLVQRKTGVEVEGLTPSQASDDFSSDSDGDEIESELQRAFALEADDEIVEIE